MILEDVRILKKGYIFKYISYSKNPKTDLSPCAPCPISERIDERARIEKDRGGNVEAIKRTQY